MKLEREDPRWLRHYAKMTLSEDEKKREKAFEILRADRMGAYDILRLVAIREKLGGGWGRSMRRLVAAWFNDKTPDELVHEATSCFRRKDWTLRDLLRKAHPKAQDAEHNTIYRWLTTGITEEIQDEGRET